MYDAIVVGARCAGSPTAMLLARAGYKVLVVDRDTFPSDTLSTAFFQPDAVLRLKKWGIYDRLVGLGTPEYTSMHIALGPMEMDAPYMELPAFAPRRTVLDKLLVDVAREAGAEVREGCSVQEIIRDANGVVTGVRFQKNGESTTESARIVIGADGRHSVVARALEAPMYEERPGVSSGYYSLFTGFDPHTAQFYVRGGYLVFVFPTNDGAAYVGFEAAFSEFNGARQDPQAFLERVAGEFAPAVAERLKSAERVEKWFGVGGRESFYRKPFGPGWALVGDAGYLKDPFLGDGINDSFRDAELLAEAIDAGFSGRQPLEEALATYEITRNEVTMERYQLTHDLCAALGSEPSMELIGRMGASNAERAAALAAL